MPLKTVKPDVPFVLLVNPWICDFAAYDFWAKPLGLLYLAAIFRQQGYAVAYEDCLDRFHPSGTQTDPFARYGRGPYLKTPIPKPDGLRDVPRNYSRYGIESAWFRKNLSIYSKPDLILVASGMTYWYPGVEQSVALLKEIYPQVPIVLGGIYATLCPAHAAAHSGTEHIFTGSDITRILQLAADYTGYEPRPLMNPEDLDTYPYPGLDLQRKIGYIPLLTSTGCPFSCAYCASSILNPEQKRRRPEAVLEEIRFWHDKHEVKDFVLYDDAFLIQAETHALPILEGICRSNPGIRLHTPNALHIREITKQTAELMFRAGVTTLRLGLETTAFECRQSIDGKVTEREFRESVMHLKRAGFEKNRMGAYLLTGLPGQPLDTVVHSIQTVKAIGMIPILSYYSPIPHTALWDQAVAASRYDLASDPVFTNNAIFPCQKEPFSWETVSRLKKIIDG